MEPNTTEMKRMSVAGKGRTADRLMESNGMRVGITYDLREDYRAEGYSEEETAEFDRIETIEAIELTLQELGYRTDRIGHVKHLVARLAMGERWDWVFNIAEGLRGYGREAQVPALLDAYAIPYTFSDPLVLSLTLHKAMTKHVVRDLGIPTPDFAVIETEDDLEAMQVPFPVFAKPIAEGTGKGIGPASKARSSQELLSVCRRLLHEHRQPVLVEAFLPGRELTVGVVGTGADAQVLGVMEVVLKDHAEGEAYTFMNKARYEELVEYRLAYGVSGERAGATALAAWRGLGCRDGGRIDLREDAHGVPHFLEVNPLAGLNPVHSDLPILCSLAGVTYRELIARIMDSALRRKV